MPITGVLVTTEHHSAERKPVSRINEEVLNDLGPLTLLFRLIRILATSFRLATSMTHPQQDSAVSSSGQRAPRRRTLLTARVGRELRHGLTLAYETSRMHQQTSWSNPKRRFAGSSGFRVRDAV
ncbi:hypothetical protein, partial [Brevibacterium sp. HMSC24B04]|uniref:hypothetical protein n=1 Tax=Brevibacterium sp. HMSC24B04 TaxID=1581060 RepID=UPI001C405020